ncbi:hypothetical protein Taro_025785 [Colocasia esculenta]|uniref:Uncharacterized protein n=1 Tax=Colocasia esculenta TaxID=4460 RepID=A0A843VF84_COLES|nr:hypothetical protein [Colocasia esculenta]
MDRFKLKLDIYRDYDLKEVVTRMGPEREVLSPQIDVDELFEEEHPLNAWVETRQERDVPEFDPRNCSWAEGELDGVEARDPELRVSEDPPLALGPLLSQPRHSAILPETSRVPPTQPALRRTATQKERSSKAIELEKRTYTRQKKRKVQQPIRSDDTTQDLNDDDDDDNGAATGATGVGQGYAGYTGTTCVGLTENYVPETEHQGGGGEVQGHGQGGYEGQHHAAYEWPPWEPNYSSGSTHIPAFQPPILPYLDISSLPYGVQGGWGPWPSQEQEHSEATSTYKPLGIWCPAPSQSGENSSQQFTPRGIQIEAGVSPLPPAFFRAAEKSTVLCMEYLAANFPGLVPLWAMLAGLLVEVAEVAISVVPVLEAVLVVIVVVAVTPPSPIVA